MKPSTLAAWLISALTLYSCGYNRPKPELQYAINNSTPTCTGESDCTKKWEAAQIWVAKNAGAKISIVTPVLIETADGEDSELSVRVTKEIQGGETYKILFKGWCHNLFGCVPDHNKAQYDFNLFVDSYGRDQVNSRQEEESLNKFGAYDKQWGEK